MTARLKNFLRDWLSVLGLKEGLVECATVCVKSEVILVCRYDKWNVSQTFHPYSILTEWGKITFLIYSGFLDQFRNGFYFLEKYSSLILRQRHEAGLEFRTMKNGVGVGSSMTWGDCLSKLIPIQKKKSFGLQSKNFQTAHISHMQGLSNLCLCVWMHLCMVKCFGHTTIWGNNFLNWLAGNAYDHSWIKWTFWLIYLFPCEHSIKWTVDILTFTYPETRTVWNFTLFKLADRMHSMRTNGASTNRDSCIFSPSKLLRIQIMTNFREWQNF